MFEAILRGMVGSLLPVSQHRQKEFKMKRLYPWLVLLAGLLILWFPQMVRAQYWHNEFVDCGSDFAGEWTSIAFDGLGEPHISYYCASTQDLKYAHKSGGVWIIETVDRVGNVGKHSSIAVDADNYPHISYYDVSNGDLKYAFKNAAGWTITAVDIGGNVGEYTSIVLDPATGNPYISYYDVTNNRLKVAIGPSPWSFQIVDNDGGTWTSLEWMDEMSDECDLGISYYHATSSEVRFAWRDLSGTWHHNAVGTGISSSMKGTSLELGGNDIWVVFDQPGTSNQMMCAQSGHILPPVWTVNAVPGIEGEYASLALVGDDSPPRTCSYNATNTRLDFAGMSDYWVWYSPTAGWVDPGPNVGEYSAIDCDLTDNNHIGISYYDAGHGVLKYADSDDDGLTWTVEPIDGGSDVGSWTSIALDGSDRPRISYYDATNGNLRYINSSSSGCYPDWNPVMVIDISGNVGQCTSLEVSGPNEHISYHGGALPGSNEHLKYVKSSTGGSTWGIPLTLDGPSPSVGRNTSIALDPSGNPRISYDASSVGDLRYIQFNVIWQPFQTIDNLSNTGNWTSLTVKGSDEYISCNDISSGLRCFHSLTGGVTWLPPPGSPSASVDGPNVGNFNSIAADNGEGVHISYHDYTNNRLKYAYWNGLWWTRFIVDNPPATDVGQFTSIALFDNVPFISYYDATGRQLKFARWDGSWPLSWDISVVDNGGPDDVGKYSSLVIDHNYYYNRPEISYYDATNGCLKYACADSLAFCDVWIGDNPSDVGNVPSRWPWWLSPDIYRDNDMTGVPDGFPPVPGALNHLRVVVHNRGSEGCNNVTVDLRYRSPSWIFNRWPDGATSIATVTIPSIPAHTSWMSPPIAFTPPLSFNPASFSIGAVLSCATDPPAGTIVFTPLDNNVGEWGRPWLWIVRSDTIVLETTTDFYVNNSSEEFDHFVIDDTFPIPPPPDWTIEYFDSNWVQIQMPWTVSLDSGETRLVHMVVTAPQDAQHGDSAYVRVMQYDSTLYPQPEGVVGGIDFPIKVDLYPPAPITDLTASPVNDSTTLLQWTPVTTDTTGGPENVACYNVYGDTFPDFEPDTSNRVARVAIDQDTIASGFQLWLPLNPYDGWCYIVRVEDQAGYESENSNLVVGVAAEISTHLPKTFSLAQNYPNPFNPITEIRYNLPVDCQVRLEIYNILGQKVATLVDESQKAGYKAVQWDGRGVSGGEVSSGIYFCRLEAGDFTATKKMVLLK